MYEVQHDQNIFNIFMFDGDMNNILIGCFLLYVLLGFIFNIVFHSRYLYLKPFYILNIIILQTKAVGHNDRIAFLLMHVYGNISHNLKLLTFQ